MKHGRDEGSQLLPQRSAPPRSWWSAVVHPGSTSLTRHECKQTPRVHIQSSPSSWHSRDDAPAERNTFRFIVYAEADPKRFFVMLWQIGNSLLWILNWLYHGKHLQFRCWHHAPCLLGANVASAISVWWMLIQVSPFSPTVSLILEGKINLKAR